MNEYKSYSEYSSNAPTLIVLPSDDDTEVQPSMQSSEEGDQSIASRMRYQLARQKNTTNHCTAHRIFTIATEPTNADYAHRPKRPFPDISTHKRQFLDWFTREKTSTSKTFTPLLGKSHKVWFIYGWDTTWGSWLRAIWLHKFKNPLGSWMEYTREW